MPAFVKRCQRQSDVTCDIKIRGDLYHSISCSILSGVLPSSLLFVMVPGVGIFYSGIRSRRHYVTPPLGYIHWPDFKNGCLGIIKTVFYYLFSPLDSYLLSSLPINIYMKAIYMISRLSSTRSALLAWLNLLLVLLYLGALTLYRILIRLFGLVYLQIASLCLNNCQVDQTLYNLAAGIISRLHIDWIHSSWHMNEGIELAGRYVPSDCLAVGNYWSLDFGTRTSTISTIHIQAQVTP
jgi:hypothetical protein